MDEWIFKVGDRVEITGLNVAPIFRGRIATVIGFRGDYGMLDIDGIRDREVLFTKGGQDSFTLIDESTPVSESDLLEVLSL